MNEERGKQLRKVELFVDEALSILVMCQDEEEECRSDMPERIYEEIGGHIDILSDTSQFISRIIE